ncbi:MAG TPA: calcium-binding protein [Falsiroseomonas sp.]|nr:calcium-binding protein [Falsiroseomonas sp.]
MGGDGNDYLISDGNAVEVLDGGAGEDTLGLATYTHERLADLAGIEAVRTNGYHVQGTAAANLFDFTGMFVSDTGGLQILGLGDNDTLIGTIENDILDGGSGNDQLDGGPGNDSLAGDTGDDLLEAGAGADTLRGEAGADTLLGGDGNDFFYVNGEVGDVLDGGAGEDTVALG